MLEFTLYGETPAKKNSRLWLKNGRNIPSARFRAWHDVAVGTLCKQMAEQCGVFGISHAVKITLHFYHGDLRRRDSDNGLSSVLDTLTDAQILTDDNWQVVRKIEVENDYDKGNPRVRIQIEPLNDYKNS